MKGLFTRNICLKLISLAFAVALWFFVVGEKGTEVGFLIPLEFKNIPDDLLIVESPPREIEVRVTGPKGLLSNLSQRQISASIDMKMSHPGINKYTVSPDNIKTPRGIVVTRVNPTVVRARFEGLITREMAIKPVTFGKPANGYEVAGIEVIPPSVRVVGTVERLKKLRVMRTTIVNIEGIKEDRDVTVSFEVPERGIKRFTPDKVELKIRVRAKEEKRKK